MLAMFSELFCRGVLATPALAESRCQRLRDAAKEKLPIGPIVISAEQAEAIVQEANKALHDAGHTGLVASGLAGGELSHEQDREVPAVPLRSVLRKVRKVAEISQLGETPQQLRWRASLRTSTFEHFEVKSFKDEEFWIKDSGTEVFCDDCSLLVASTSGKLHGGSSRGAKCLFFARDTFSCHDCLHQRKGSRAIREADMSAIFVETATTGHSSLVACEECRQLVGRKQARCWDDRNKVQHWNCEACWERARRGRR